MREDRRIEIEHLARVGCEEIYERKGAEVLNVNLLYLCHVKTQRGKT